MNRSQKIISKVTEKSPDIVVSVSDDQKQAAFLSLNKKFKVFYYEGSIGVLSMDKEHVESTLKNSGIIEFIVKSMENTNDKSI